MGFDNAYEAINESDDGRRWAFGTGFEDPLVDLDAVHAALPAGVDGADLSAYCQMLGDDALVLSHRLQQWLTRAPELEEETALANIALDLLGQARLLLTRAGQADGTGRNEDDYAFTREPGQFRNVRFVEPEDPDFGALMIRLLIFSSWRLALLARLRASRDGVLAAVAGKGVKEVTYHRDYAAEWVVRLGDGTDYSHARVRAGLESAAPLIPELFRAGPIERRLVEQAVAVDPAALRPEVDAVLTEVLTAAGLPWPPPAPAPTRPDPAEDGGRAGVHTSALAGLLTELQSVARALPGASW